MFKIKVLLNFWETELMFKLEYCPVEKKTFNIKVEKQKNKVHYDLFANSNSAYSNHRKNFYTLYEKIKFVPRHTIQHQVVCSDYFSTLMSPFQLASDSHIWLHRSKNTHTKLRFLRMAAWHQLLLYLTQGKQGKCAEVAAKFWLSDRGVFKTHMHTKWVHILQKCAKGAEARVAQRHAGWCDTS